jgi:oxygen-dependent protoporphyrinogen oxidase
MSRLRVAVLGSGVTGLAAAYRVVEIARERRIDLDLQVIDRSTRPGGIIGTDEIEGFRVERCADGFITEKPALIELARRLGIEHRLVRTLPAPHGAFVAHRGSLEPIPAGFSMMAPTQLRAFWRSPLLSTRGKLRALGEVLVPRRAVNEDESLASFVRRRFGDELLAQLAQPLVGGIYGADPELLSLRATMPRFLDEELSSGSVTLGLRQKARAAKQEASGARYSLFASFDHGMQVLVDTLVAALPTGALRSGVEVTGLSRSGEETLVATRTGTERFDRVILALPAWPAARLLDPFSPLAARKLGSITHGSAATVTFGFRERSIPERLAGYGFVVPRAEGRPSLAGTFASRKWPDRAPGSSDLVRVFLGDQLAEQASDEELARIARQELRALAGIDGEAIFTRIVRYLGTMPQYHVGHLDRARSIEQRLAIDTPWLAVAGIALRGVGLPDAVRAGETAAEQALAPA